MSRRSSRNSVSPERESKRKKHDFKCSNSNSPEKVQSIHERRRHSSVWSSEKHKILPSEFLCLYDVDGDNDDILPKYIKRGEQETPILEVVEPVSRPEEFVDPSFDDEQKQLLECFQACVEEMLGGLLLCDENIPNWSDTRKLSEREEESAELERSYSFDMPPDFTTKLHDVYNAFTRGFHNSDARTALHRIFCFCRQLVGKKEISGVKNIGGGAEYIGNSQTIPLYCELNSFPCDEVKKVVEDTLNVIETDTLRRPWVPDCVMFNGNEEEFYVFGECQSGTNVKTSLMRKVWHESLRGLLELKYVYGFGMSSKNVILCKLSTTNFKLVTYTTDIDFRNYHIQDTDGKSAYFDTNKFMQFIALLTRIVQDNSTGP